MSDTIFAVSSGAPPAAIAVLRVSGSAARAVTQAVAGEVPVPRRATLRRLRDSAGETLDRALVLWFPGPATATGEDVLELHLHGGGAVIAAVERAVAAVGARRAEPGEFTRRALLAGRIDLAQTAGLADLLAAETEAQRRAAQAASEGALSREVRAWLDRLSNVRAGLEAAIDYDDDGDVGGAEAAFGSELTDLTADLVRRIAAPTSERVREGWRVVIAGPPNAGKSSLFNAMTGRDAAIVAPLAGTTRDSIEARVHRSGQLFTIVDTAGLAEWTDDPIEREGMRRSREAIAAADLVLWMGDGAPPAREAIWLLGRCDDVGRSGAADRLSISSRRPPTIDALWRDVLERLSLHTVADASYLLQERQRETLVRVADELRSAATVADPLLQAEHLRRASITLASLLGVDAGEAMLDALFSRFCVGK